MSIIIYTRNDCVQCHATKRAMESRGVAFEMVNIDLQPEAADTLRAQGFRQLPVVVPGEAHGYHVRRAVRAQGGQRREMALAEELHGARRQVGGVDVHRHSLASP